MSRRSNKLAYTDGASELTYGELQKQSCRAANMLRRLGVRREERVAMITQSLNFIFEHEHTLSLDRLKSVSKREARQFLRDLPGINAFVEAYVMQFAFDGHAVPIDDEILAYLKGQEIVDDSTSIEDAQKFVEHHLKADEVDEFSAVIRRAAHSDGSRRKARS